VPTLVIGWSHKYQEVLEMFGAEQWALPHNEAELGTLIERFEQLAHEQERVAAQLQAKLPSVRSRSLEQADLIAAIVAKGSSSPS
jgi:colanic acid/amylovoran biosynthesis protein